MIRYRLRTASALAAALLSACAPSEGPPRAPVAPENSAAVSFVGGRRCAECHPREVDRWRGSHHDLAMQEATPETVLGDFDDAVFTSGGVTTTFLRRDGRFVVRTDGSEGELGEFEISYTFGVEPLQQYLIARPDGRLQALSICWDTRPAAAGGQRWFHLYPEGTVDHTSRLHWTGIDQNWNYMCAECHSTGLQKGYDPETDRYATTWSEIDVSCEACHGPGASHVAWAEGRPAAGEARPAGVEDSRIGLGRSNARRWIVEPATGMAHLETPAELSSELTVCARCHSRRAPIDDAFDAEVEPGADFADRYRLALLEDGLYHADGAILDEVYVYGSFLQSRMHVAGVTCSDCHDPHSADLVAADADAVCSRCHDPNRFAAIEHHHHAEGSAGASCVDCHMPSRNYMLVDPRRDHGFRVPRPDLSVELGTPNACGDCHRDRPSAWVAARFAELYGDRQPESTDFARGLDAGRRIAADAEARLSALATDRAAPGIVRATAAELLAGHLGPASLPALEQALGDADPLVRAAAVRSLAGLPPEARLAKLAGQLDDPVRLVRIDAARALAAVSPAEMSGGHASRWRAAIEEARVADLAAAERPEARTQLGTLEALLGNTEDAERHLHRALEIDPAYVPAYVNLADLFRATGRDRLGEAWLRDGLSHRPDAADLRHVLGLLLVRQQRLPEALPELERATAGRPEEPRYGYVFGVALHTAGQSEQAVGVLERAHLRSPGDLDLMWALATIQRDLGNSAAALDYAERMLRASPTDPRPARLLAETRRSR